MTDDSYKLLCERIARKAVRYAAQMAEEDAPDNVTDEREHWIDVYLDERLPDLDTDFILDMTNHNDAVEQSTGRAAPSREIAARRALQADIWDAINRLEP